MRLIDLSTVIEAGMPKPPSAPEVTMSYILEQSEEEEQKKGYTNKLEQYTITTHVATHFDAPAHFTMGGKNIDEFPLELFYHVPTLYLKIWKEDYGKITAEDIRQAELVSGPIQKGDFVIIDTGFYRFYEEERYLRTPYLDLDAAKYLTEKGISILGTDCFTVDDVREKKKPSHVHLLKEKEVLIIECLTGFDQVTQNRFKSMCMPLKIKNGSGAFTRVVGIME